MKKYSFVAYEKIKIQGSKLMMGVKMSFFFLGTIHPMFFLRKFPMEFFQFHFWSFESFMF
jgi:hypothetical protein